MSIPPPSEAQVRVLLALAEERARLTGLRPEHLRYCLADGRGMPIRQHMIRALLIRGWVEVRGGSLFDPEQFLVITPQGLEVVQEWL